MKVIKAAVVVSKTTIFFPFVFMFYSVVQPASVFVGRPYSNNNNNVAFNRTYNELTRVQSPLFWQVSGSQQFAHMWEEQYKVNNFTEQFD